MMWDQLQEAAPQVEAAETVPAPVVVDEYLARQLEAARAAAQ